MWKLVNLPSQYFPYGISSDTVVINVLKAYHFFHKISQNWHQNWPFNQYLRPSIRKFTIYDTPFRSILSQNWPNSQFDLITDDHIPDSHCTYQGNLGWGQMWPLMPCHWGCLGAAMTMRAIKTAVKDKMHKDSNWGCLFQIQGVSRLVSRLWLLISRPYVNISEYPFNHLIT